MFSWATFGDVNRFVDGQHSKKKMCSLVKFCEVNGGAYSEMKRCPRASFKDLNVFII